MSKVFSRIPFENNLKQQWITKINRQDWTPTKYSKICSCHFNDEDFIVTRKGLRKLKKGSLPCLKLDTSLKPIVHTLMSSPNHINDFLILNDTPREKRLKQEIVKLRFKAKLDGLKIKRLQMKVNRMKKKVQNQSASIK